MFPFYDGSGKDEDTYMECYLGGPLRELGAELGMTESLRPHRFRDSFAINRLNLGLSLLDVSIRLGHKSIDTTKKHYLPFVLSVEEALEHREDIAMEAALYREAEAARPEESLLSVN